MAGGVIITSEASGDVYFLDNQGKEVIESSQDVEVKMREEFAGISLKDAVDEAKRFAIGALKKKTDQKRRGHDCTIVVRNVKIDYKVKYGFKGEEQLTREVDFKAGDLILKKGDHGQEFFWVKEGIVEVDGVEYKPGNIFGRAAFSDGIRKKDVYAKTDVTVVAINKEHPDLIEKLPVILEKFAQEVDMIKKVRPKESIDKINVEDIE
ncbi:MAG: cyclic nucleotide-binding domain-containing protein [Spirochaetales bacterium]|nr:cyclic nucleotide-binding domain-containing protein [Spirochaetales bacterium]